MQENEPTSTDEGTVSATEAAAEVMPSAAGEVGVGALARTLQDVWTLQRKELDQLLRALTPLSRGVEQASADDLQGVSKSLARLNLTDSILQAQATELSLRLEEAADRRAVELRERLLRDLQTAAADAAVVFKKLADHPLEVGIGPLEVSIPENGEATIRLGREVIETVRVDGRRIVNAAVAAADALKRQAIPTTEFLEMLLRAWRMALAAGDASPDGRIDIVDTLLPLGLLQSGPRTWRRIDGGKGPGPMSRARLAYQLYRARREGVLQVNGWRFELAAATLASTKDPRNVLWVLRPDGTGQFYGSLRFVRAGSPEASAASPESDAAVDTTTTASGTSAGSAAAAAPASSAPSDENLNDVLSIFGDNGE